LISVEELLKFTELAEVTDEVVLVLFATVNVVETGSTLIPQAESSRAAEAKIGESFEKFFMPPKYQTLSRFALKRKLLFFGKL
jgi:hypothetical protein